LAALTTTAHNDDCVVHLTTTAITRARRALLGPVDRNLLQPSQASEFGPRYRQHDLIRASARLCLREDPETQRRHDLIHLGRACLATLEHVESWRYGGNLPTRFVTESDAVLVRVADHATAHRWVGVERENLLAVVDALDERCGPVAQLLAASLTELGHRAQARHCYERAYASYTQLELDPYRAHVLRGLAADDTQVGDYAAARQNYQRALALSRRSRDRTGQALALRGLGDIHRLTDNYEAACACFHRSLRLLDDQIHARSDDMILRRYRALTLTTLGTIEQMYDRTSVALDLLRRADHDFAVVGDALGRSTVLCRLAKADRTAGELAAAHAKFTQVLALAQRLAEPTLVAEALWGLGQVAKDKGDYATAATLFGDIMALDTVPEGSLQHTTALLALAETARFSQQWDKAQMFYEQARQACKTLGDRQGVAEALAGLGFTADATGRSEQAQEYLRLAIIGYEEIGHPFGAKLRRFLGPR
jgi:tetratricopeptide (TPR) repeat protein